MFGIANPRCLCKRPDGRIIGHEYRIDPTTSNLHKAYYIGWTQLDEKLRDRYGNDWY